MKGQKGQKLSQEIRELREQLARAIADYRNLEGRIEREAEQFRQRLSWSLLDKLLPVLDDLERAEKHLRDHGLTMAVNQFKKVLASEGIEPIKSEGAEFNPETMDCVAVVAGPKNKVVATLRRGYLLNGKVIRPAKVKVGRGKGGSDGKNNRH